MDLRPIADSQKVILYVNGRRTAINTVMGFFENKSFSLQEAREISFMHPGPRHTMRLNRVRGKLQLCFSPPEEIVEGTDPDSGLPFAVSLE